MSKIKEKKSEKVNVKLLEKISEHILEEPKRVNMDAWIEEDPKVHKHACHTVGCIAGWAVLLKGTKSERKGNWWEIKETAKRLLRVSEDDANTLFYAGQWPEERQDQLTAHREGSKAYAKVVAARIADFIKEKTK